MNKKLSRLPDTELEIMQVIWDHPTPISTSEVKAVLDEKRAWNIGALQTLLNRLIKRGFLESGKDGKNKTYTPLIDEQVYLAMENKSLLERLNGNSITKFVTALYNDDALSKKDLKDLMAFIESKTKVE